MSASVESLQRPRIFPASPCYDIQEFRSRSQSSDDSFEDFLPAIEVMSICSQLSKYKSAFGKTDSRRVRFALIPAVFGIDGSSPPHVSSWGYKPVGFPDSKGGPSKRTRSNMMKRNDESRCDIHEHRQRWSYSSPAFYCRSPPAQLYKYKNALKTEQSSADPCDVPGMTVQQAILFRRTLSTKFFANNQDCQESRKHNNTPVCFDEVPQKALKKRVSMPDLRYIQTYHDGRESKDSKNYGSLRQMCKNENRRVKSQKEVYVVKNVEDNIPAAKCSLCIVESQDVKKQFIQAKKIDIKLPCLDTNQEG